MNKEVDFDLAKLLKEKGCDIKCYFYFHSSLGKNYTYNPEGKIGELFTNWNAKKEFPQDYISRPIIVDIVMWIYEKYNILISVNSDKAVNWESVYQIKIDWIYPEDNPDIEDDNGVTETRYLKYKGVNEFKTINEAYTEGIKYTLKELLK